MRILYIVGRLGMGGDSSAIFNALEILIEEKKLKVSDVDFLTHDIGYNQTKVNELRQKGYNVYILPGDVRKMGPVKYYFAVKKILNEMGPYDVVHTHTSVQSGVALLAAKMCKVPKRVCHAHTNSIQRKTSAISRILITPILRSLIVYAGTDRVACGKIAGEFLYGTHQFEILENGIDLELFGRASQEESKVMHNKLINNERQILVGHVGRFSEMKNQKYIISLAERMNNCNVKFVLVGDGEGYEEVKHLATKKNVAIDFLGRRSDIPQLMMAFDLLILPSLEGEGFPVTLVEAQAAGCPCIASTNVTRESDLGMNLLTFIDLADYQEWIDQITSCNGKKINKTQAIEHVKKLGFDKRDAANKWFAVYESAVK